MKLRANGSSVKTWEAPELTNFRSGSCSSTLSPRFNSSKLALAVRKRKTKHTTNQPKKILHIVHLHERKSQFGTQLSAFAHQKKFVQQPAAQITN